MGGDALAYETGLKRCLICADIEREKKNAEEHNLTGVHVTLRARQPWADDDGEVEVISG